MAVMAGDARIADGRRVAALVIEHVDHDTGDVVAPGRLVGQTHEFAGGLGWIGQPTQCGGDAALVDLVEQAIAAQQVAVADDGDDLPGVDENRAVDAERAREDVALRMHGGLVGGDATLPLQRGHEAVVLGDLGEFAVGEQIKTGVAHVDDGHRIAPAHIDQRESTQGGAHAREFDVVGGALDHGEIGLLDGSHERVGARRGERGLEGLEGEMTGHFTSLMSTHAVGHGEQAVDGEQRILVALTHAPGVGGRAPGQTGHCSSRMVLPIWRRSPGFITMGPDTF